MVRFAQMNSQYDLPAEAEAKLDPTFKEIMVKMLSNPMTFCCAYSDSSLFCKRSDFCNYLPVNEVNSIYADYINSCVRQKKVWKSSQHSDMHMSRCPRFDYNTIKCILLGELCKGKFGRCEVINDAWFAEGGLRQMYLDIVEELNDDNVAITVTEQNEVFDGDIDFEEPNSNFYLKSCNDLKVMNIFMEKFKTFNYTLWDLTLEAQITKQIMDIDMAGENPEWVARGGIKDTKFVDDKIYLLFNNTDNDVGVINFPQFKRDNELKLASKYY